MLRFIKCEIGLTKPFATDMHLKFEDSKINLEQYTFLNSRLDNYNLYIDNEYSMTSETQFDENLQRSSIKITLRIPNRLMPKSAEETKEIMIVHIDRFLNFYDRYNKSFKYKQNREYAHNPTI
jgi:hypothetical protein